jgi:hypothetical protein
MKHIIKSAFLGWIFLCGWNNSLFAQSNVAPFSPSDVAVYALNTQSVQVQWQDRSTNESNFGIRRSKNGEAWQLISASIPANQTFFNDINLDPNGHYCYAVFALNAGGNSDASNIACAVTTSPNIFSPILTTAQLIQTTSVSLSWTTSGASSSTFNIQTRPIGGGWTTLQTGITGTTGYHQNMPEVTTFCYRIEAVTSGSGSYYSNEICATSGALPPQAVANVRFVPDTTSPHQILVASWDANAPQSGLIYEVQTRDPNGAWSNSIEQSATSYTLANLASVKSFEVRVRAKRVIAGQILYSAWSSPVRATTWLGIYPGDTNGDGRANLSDITFLTQSLFYGAATPFRNNPPVGLEWKVFTLDPTTYSLDLLRADANRDGKVDIFDIFPIIANYNRVASSNQEGNQEAIQARITSPQQAEVLTSVLDVLNTMPQDAASSTAQKQLAKDLAALLQTWQSELPKQAALGQNYPNPFQETTTLVFDLAEKQEVKLNVYNLLGQKVTTILDETLPPGRYTQAFHANDLPSGLYLVEMQAEKQRFTKLITLQK